ncbi:unnamed protein product [Owenia fusiformis]|uniref:Uncharacterized protein n=1 Tax=Owenia fusiformis TaxID=6347 RepID=A0A8J1U0L8_OWEFU|nr:unnamed protein product [Owenia fusiformis]
MSLNELSRPKLEPNVSRSKSFNGIAALNKSPPVTPTGTMVLGRSVKSPRSGYKSPHGSIGFSFKKSGKVPKVPRPHRTMTMFEHVKNGLRDTISTTEEDIESFRLSEQNSLSSSQQIKAAERYKKRLEFHYAKIEELEDSYILQDQLREGVRNMARAYVSQPMTHQKESLSSVKLGFKECSQTMCAIEAQLENMMGTLHCKMKGMVGFARLCPGDVFEVNLKYGSQKWKTRGKIGRSTNQHWDNDSMVFKALVADVMCIKASEVKSLGKHMLLGQKNCETKDLFSSHPQLMTISINTNGSLKLSVVITWNPLEGVDENMSYYDPPPKHHATPKKPLPNADEAVYRIKHGADQLDSYYYDGSGTSTDDSPKRRQRPKTEIIEHTIYENEDYTRPQRPKSEMLDHLGHSNGSLQHDNRSFQRDNQTNGATSGGISHNTRLLDASVASVANLPKPQLFDMRLLTDSLENTTDAGNKSNSLEDALYSLITVLEDYQGQYTELQNLEEQVAKLDKLLKKRMGAGSGRSSNVSISIESALEAFDFLESEDVTDDMEPSSYNYSRKASLETRLQSPDSTQRTADSGIESLGNRLSEDGHLSSGGCSPEPPSTGNDEVDVALIQHLAYCERLLENLGNFGPLKCKEIYSLDKLQRQSDIIESLIEIAQRGAHITNLEEVMHELTHSMEEKKFWVSCVDNYVLYTMPDRFLLQLEKSFGDKIREKYDTASNKVLRCLVARILDIPMYDPDHPPPNTVITLHQFMDFFNETEHSDLGSFADNLANDDTENMSLFVDDLATELWMSNRLRSGTADVVIKTVLMFRDTIPPASCLRVLSLLLITENSDIRKAVTHYLKGLVNNEDHRDKAMVVYVEALEDRNADVRCAACMALSLLQATESIDQLVYICQTDSSLMVKSKAKETLYSYGAQGRKAYDESQLSTHGFQGVRLHQADTKL